MDSKISICTQFGCEIALTFALFFTKNRMKIRKKLNSAFAVWIPAYKGHICHAYNNLKGKENFLTSFLLSLIWRHWYKKLFSIIILLVLIYIYIYIFVISTPIIILF